MASLSRKFVDRMLELGGECDFARDVALYYPLRVLMSVLGVPESDEGRMLQLTQKLLQFRRHLVAFPPDSFHEIFHRYDAMPLCEVCQCCGRPVA